MLNYQYQTPMPILSLFIIDIVILNILALLEGINIGIGHGYRL